jgi:hypothetical protein
MTTKKLFLPSLCLGIVLGIGVWTCGSREGGPSSPDAKQAASGEGPDASCGSGAEAEEPAGGEAPDPLDADAALPPGPWSLAGRVVDSHGAPIAGASVRLAREHHRASDFFELLESGGFFGSGERTLLLKEAYTERTGRFAFGPVDPGEAQIFVSAGGWDAMRATIDLPREEEVEIALERPALVHGTAWLGDRTLCGVRVTFEAWGRSSAPTTSAEDGAYRLEVPVLREGKIQGAIPGRPPVFLEIRPLDSGEDREVDLRFPEGASLDGIVFEPDGRRAARARISVEQWSRGMTCVEVRAGRRGEFLIEGLAPGKYRIVAGRLDGDSGEPQATDAPVVQVGEPGTRETVLIVLEGFAELGGRVLDGEDGPVEGALVHISYPGKDTMRGGLRSDADGNFVARVPAAREYTLTVFPPRTLWVGTFSHTTVPGLRDGERRGGHTLRLGRPVGVGLCVVDEEGFPVEGALVRGVPGPRQWTYSSFVDADTDEAGWVRGTAWPDAFYRAEVKKAGFLPAVVGLEIPDEGGTVEEIVILKHIGPGVITGRVRREDGRPIRGAYVCAARWVECEIDGEMIPMKQSDTVPAVLTDLAGEFRITGIGDSTFEVDAAAQGFLDLHRREVRSGDDLDLILVRVPEIGGQVVFTGGEPAAGVKVQVGLADALTDEDGSFRFLAIGGLGSSITVDGDSIYSEEFDITILDDPLLLEVEPRPMIEGFLLDHRGEPVADDTVQASIGGETRWSFATDDQGRFAFRWPRGERPRPEETMSIAVSSSLEKECLPIEVPCSSLKLQRNILVFPAKLIEEEDAAPASPEPEAPEVRTDPDEHDVR